MLPRFPWCGKLLNIKTNLIKFAGLIKIGLHRVINIQYTTFIYLGLLNSLLSRRILTARKIA